MYIEFSNGERFEVYSAGYDPVFQNTISINFITHDFPTVAGMIANADNLKRIVWSDTKQEIEYIGYTSLMSIMRSNNGNIQVWLSKEASE